MSWAAWWSKHNEAEHDSEFVEVYSAAHLVMCKSYIVVIKLGENKNNKFELRDEYKSSQYIGGGSLLVYSAGYVSP